MDDVVERAIRWGLSYNDGYARVLADEVRRLREVEQRVQELIEDVAAAPYTSEYRDGALAAAQYALNGVEGS